MNLDNGVIKLEAVNVTQDQKTTHANVCITSSTERQLTWADIDAQIIDPLLKGNAWYQELQDLKSRPENTVSVNVAMSADLTKLKAELSGLADTLEQAKSINEELYSAKQALEFRISGAVDSIGRSRKSGSLDPDDLLADVNTAVSIVANSQKLSGDLATLTARCEQQAQQIASLQDEILALNGEIAALKTKTVMEAPVPETRASTFTIKQETAGGFDPDKVAAAFQTALEENLPAEPAAPANILEVEIPSTPEEIFKSNALRDVMEIKGDLRKEVCASALECFHKHEDGAAKLKLRQWLGVQIKVAIADLLKIDTDLAGELMNEALKEEKAKAAEAALPPPPSSTMAQFDAAYKASTYKTDRQKITDALIKICKQGEDQAATVSKSGVLNVANVLRQCTLDKAAWEAVFSGTPGQTVLDKLLPALTAVNHVKLTA